MNTLHRPLDETDRDLIAAMRRSPRAAHAELAREVGIARGTVYTRLERLEREGVITGYGPDVDPRRAGLDVRAFCLLEIAQGSLASTEVALAAIPEVLEVHTVTGAADLLCQIVTTSNDHLHDVLQQIAAVDTVNKSETLLSLATNVSRSVADVLVS